jgi:hypothetical protein
MNFYIRSNCNDANYLHQALFQMKLNGLFAFHAADLTGSSERGFLPASRKIVTQAGNGQAWLDAAGEFLSRPGLALTGRPGLRIYS